MYGSYKLRDPLIELGSRSFIEAEFPHTSAQSISFANLPPNPLLKGAAHTRFAERSLRGAENGASAKAKEPSEARELQWNALLTANAAEVTLKGPPPGWRGRASEFRPEESESESALSRRACLKSFLKLASPADGCALPKAHEQ